MRYLIFLFIIITVISCKISTNFLKVTEVLVKENTKKSTLATTQKLKGNTFCYTTCLRDSIIALSLIHI